MKAQSEKSLCATLDLSFIYAVIYITDPITDKLNTEWKKPTQMFANFKGIKNVLMCRFQSKDKRNVHSGMSTDASSSSVSIYDL